jgi:DnaJ-class molecular chaperone
MLIISLLFIGTMVYAYTQHTCGDCKGVGHIVNKCNSCYNGAIICRTCSGAKETRVKCTGCDGGYISKTVPKTCTNCNGAKSFRENQPITCTVCQGRKQVPSTVGGGRSITGRDGSQTTTQGAVTYVNCQRCSGRGQLDNYVNIACRPCGGKGTIGSETVREKHTICNNGFITSKCNTCNGIGSLSCPQCKGFANIKTDCRRCKGLGYVYTQ